MDGPALSDSENSHAAAEAELVNPEKQEQEQKHEKDLQVSPSAAEVFATPASASSFRIKGKKDIEWENITFTVDEGTKTILNKCSGHVPAGRLCAIMGASGAGKSSLLNVLAGRSASAPGIDITGRIKVDGEVIDPVEFRQRIAYVMQDDSLLATTTPREALRFSARLRLAQDTTEEEIEERVTHMLKDLGLQDCADVLIGGALIKGVSGGQRKRTSVGVEMVTDPNLLFLDEPTSGLDSFNAYQTVTLLKSVARANTTVMCTIHQPSSEVFDLFDMVIFLMQGRILYHGTVKELPQYFAERGFEIPRNYNPADYVMHVTQTEPIEVLEKRGFFKNFHAVDKSEKVEEVADAVENGNDAEAAKADRKSNELSVSANAEDYIVIKAPFTKQLKLLLDRERQRIVRDTVGLSIRFGSAFFLAIIYGLIFLDTGSRDFSDPDNFNAHFGAISMIVINSMFGASQAVLLSFPFERPMFLREYSTGTYNASAYFISKTLLEMVLTFAQALLELSIVFPMYDMQGNFILILLALWGLSCASCSVAVIIGTMVPDAKTAAETAPLLFVPQLLFAGFFIRSSLIPVFMRWAQWLCALKYTINLVLMSEFKSSNDSCQGASAAACRDVLDSNDIDSDLTAFYIVMLILLFVVPRFAACGILKKKAARFY